MIDEELHALSRRVGEALTARGTRLVTAESCTGGWIGEVVTMAAGSSAWFDRGFITYSNDAKRAVLDVGAATLLEHGAVSEATVLEMVAGALRHSNASVAVAVSGIAGPGGATPGKPVGTVCIAWGLDESVRQVRTFHMPGDRYAVRRETVVRALEGVITLLETPVSA